jgi:hypothetical protein
MILEDSEGKHLPIDGGRFRISTVPFRQSIVEGLVPGYEPFEFTGYNSDVDATAECLWVPGGDLALPAAAMGMELVSSDVKDDGDPAGVGARTVRVHYLDSAFVYHTEDVVLNGTTAVPTVATDILRVNYLEVISAGSEGDPAGNISIRHLTDSPVYDTIPAGTNASRGLKYTVPYNYQLVLTDLYVNTDVAAVVTIQQKYGLQVERFKCSAAAGNTLLSLPAMVIDPYCDVWVQAACAAGNGAVTATLYGYLAPA